MKVKELHLWRVVIDTDSTSGPAEHEIAIEGETIGDLDNALFAARLIGSLKKAEVVGTIVAVIEDDE